MNEFCSFPVVLQTEHELHRKNTWTNDQTNKLFFKQLTLKHMNIKMY